MTKKQILEQAENISKEIQVLHQCDGQQVSGETLESLRQSECVEGIVLTAATNAKMYFRVHYIDESFGDVMMLVSDWRI